ncbi:MAG: 50S ribosomal protein L17 [Puniceicoccaceae bacterium]|nr:50S ribosomal protein L17 [Puniceicoccaceae bacterium]|tara:strand:+ start:452 stop:1060 length:609 start_codon:yes stop_codon:yes gene_type:complete
MRHSKRRHILGVSGPHRSAMLGNLSVALITHGRIKTTLAKAKALRPFIEKVITLAKKAKQANDAARTLHFRRLAIARVRDKKAVAELFDNKVSEFLERAGGYTRIYKLGQRVGDAAEMALIEFIDASDEGYAKPNKKKAAKTKAVAAPAEEAEVEAEEAEVEAEEAEVEAEEAEVDGEDADSPEAVETESSETVETEAEKKD